jgi:hypothetical protein
MEFQLRCGCGETITVTEAKAESEVLCRCGGTVPVPSFFELKRLAGVPPVAPELAIERLLAAGRLPEETECVVCGVRTDDICRCWVDCEQAVVRPGGTGLHPVSLLTALLGLVVFSSRRAEEYGRDRLFYLPLRVCAGCRSGMLQHEPAVKTALGRVPLYRQLLEKYPHARVQLVKE